MQASPPRSTLARGSTIQRCTGMQQGAEREGPFVALSLPPPCYPPLHPAPPAGHADAGQSAAGCRAQRWPRAPAQPARRQTGREGARASSVAGGGERIGCLSVRVGVSHGALGRRAIRQAAALSEHPGPRPPAQARWRLPESDCTSDRRLGIATGAGGARAGACAPAPTARLHLRVCTRRTHADTPSVWPARRPPNRAAAPRRECLRERFKTRTNNKKENSQDVTASRCVTCEDHELDHELLRVRCRPSCCSQCCSCAGPCALQASTSLSQ